MSNCIEVVAIEVPDRALREDTGEPHECVLCGKEDTAVGYSLCDHCLDVRNDQLRGLPPLVVTFA